MLQINSIVYKILSVKKNNKMCQLFSGRDKESLSF